jgi:hypothetical protein
MSPGASRWSTSWCASGSRARANLRGRSDVLHYLDYDQGVPKMSDLIERLAGRRARRFIPDEASMPLLKKEAEEGGCGVTGFACNDSRARQVHLRAVDPDAEPRQRQGRRHRRGRPGARADRRLARGARFALPAADRAARSRSAHAEVEQKFVLPHFDIALSTRKNTSAITATFPAWTCARPTFTATRSGSSPTCWRPSPNRTA